MNYAYIIDDNRDTAGSMEQMLGLLGYEARVVLGPLPALEALLRRMPDVIFLDIHMQGMDGIEVCRYIRREPRLAGVPIIGISMDTQASLVKRVQEAGADGFLAKPITFETLEATVREVERRAKGGP